MARKTKEQKMADVHESAVGQFNASLSVCQEEREMCLRDRRFVHIVGATWEGAYGEQFENRVMLESNEARLAVRRIFNEYRNNRVTANFVSRTGDEGDELADLCDGLYRADEIDSASMEAYDNAFDEAVSGGMGAWRLRTEYEDEYDEDNDYQRIRFEPIYDADSTVFFDANAKRYDKSDAMHCFLLTGVQRETFEEQYGEDPTTWPKPVDDSEFDWFDGDTVYIAEYFKVEETSEVVHKYRTFDGEIIKVNESKLTDELKAQYNEVGTIPVSSKTVKRRAVHKYTLSGGGVLSDDGLIAGEHIPVIPVYGNRVFIDGIERISGHVRGVKDMIRLHNMQISVLGERAAEGGDRTPIFTPEQIEGHETLWANKAVDRPAYLTINAIEQPDGTSTPSGPIGYVEPPAVSQAEAALLQVAKAEIADLLGNQQGGDEIMANTSGLAVELVQSRLDMQSFIYMSNFAKSVRRCAQIWLSMARTVYDDEGRKMKVMDEQETADFVEIGKKVLVDGEPQTEAEIAKARFDVACDVGPASQTRRQATQKRLIEMLDAVQDPADRKVLSAVIMRNMEGEGLTSVRDYFRRQLVALGVEEPTDEEAAEMAEAQTDQAPDPNVVYLQTEAQKNEAQAAKAVADTDHAVAEAAKTRAETVEIMAKVDREDRQAAIDAAQAIAQAIGSGTAAP